MNTKLVGILNLTPDSFSDGGQVSDPAHAIERLIEAGADVIDIGAESTRPGATPLAPAEEWQRLEPVLKEVLPHFPHTLFSLDTRHAETAAKALLFPIQWINDVSGFADPAMVDAVRSSTCKLVVMHSLTVPADPCTHLNAEADPVAEVLQFAQERSARLQQAGIPRERLIFDPGIGFGKTPLQSVEIVRCLDELKACGMPLLIGHSRKSFLTQFSSPPPARVRTGVRVPLSTYTADDSRDMLTLGVSAYLYGKGVDYLRIHAVQPHAELRRLWKALHA